MPTYDFVCRSCEHRFSSFLSLADKNKVTCPQCEGKNIEQVFTVFNFAAGNRLKTSSPGRSCTGRSCSSCSGC